MPRIAVLLLIAIVSTSAVPGAHAQDGTVDSSAAPPGEKVKVSPQARDEEIQARLTNILSATGWFSSLVLRVDDGVVFLGGVADTVEHRKWASDLASRTQDVVAVVNRLSVAAPSIFEFEPATSGLRELGRSIVGALPFVVFAILVLGISWLVARLASMFTRRVLRLRKLAPLLQEVLSRGAGIAVMIVGFYVVFRIAGLTTVALSVMGGTGLLGLVLGIAFREITENFLASVFLSLQPPFRPGDLLEIDGHTGIVERLTNRATVLIALDGNHIQIPNSKVYRATIRNYTSNPNRREDFTVGIGYQDAISEAQEVAMRVLGDHPAVLSDPEPWVLVESLGAATVNLRIYFWFDGVKHSPFKLKSSIIRLVKRAFQASGISMPDEARELVFPQGVPVHVIREGVEPRSRTETRSALPAHEAEDVTTDAEAGLRSEADQLRDQSRKSRTPEEGDDLLVRPSADRADARAS